MNFRELLLFLTCIAPHLEMKDRVYASCVRSSMTYGNETRVASNLDLRCEGQKGYENEGCEPWGV